MTYNEWRDELKNNLLSVSEAERKHVLDYYAEAYADRREAGFSEKQIMTEFGAPYDAAQRVLGRTLEENALLAEEKSEEQPIVTQEAPSEYSPTTTPVETSSEKNGKRKFAKWKIILLAVIAALAVTAVTVGLSIYSVSLKYHWGERNKFTKFTKTFNPYTPINEIVLDVTGGQNVIFYFVKDTAVTVEYEYGEGLDVSVQSDLEQFSVNVYSRHVGGYREEWYTDLAPIKVYIPDSVKTISGTFSGGQLELNLVSVRMLKLNLEDFSLKLVDDTIEKIDLTAKNGTIQAYGFDCSNIGLQLTNTDANLALTAEKKLYTIDTLVANGNCNVQRQKGTADGKYITLNQNGGTVTFTFEDKNAVSR